jgi:paraquat-inducible protein B
MLHGDRHRYISIGQLYYKERIGMSEELQQKNKSMIREFWDFMKVRKKFWLLPLIILLIGAAALILFAESSAVSVFIYTLF